MANVTKKYQLSAKGILVIDNGVIGIENTESGDFFDMADLLSDFADKSIKLTVAYDEDYDTTNE